MIYGSVCSGIEAATVAWHPLGWRPAFFAEIEAFPSAVLKHHYPDVRNVGDFTRLIDAAAPVPAIDVLVGGTPCQSFSVAGLRRGLADARGGLTLEYVRLAQRLRPKWIVWENVPGVLSQDGGRAFGAFLGALGELGYGWAYRVLDAQYFGVAQRRRRVFVVGHFGGDFARAASVLLEPEGVRRDPPTRRAAREGAAPGAAGGVDGGSVPTVAETLIATDYKGPGHNRDHNFIAQTFAKTDKPMSNEDAEGWSPQDHSPTITYWPRDRSDAGTDVAVVQTMSVRRLTPIECERLQGFPDDYTRIPWKNKPASECPDGPRYKALGNSMAVPVMRWIGERIARLEAV